MKKKVGFILLLIAVMAGSAFAQNYKEGDGYKWMTSLEDNTYRILTIQTKSDIPRDDLGILRLVKTHAAGDPRIVEIVSVITDEDRIKRAEEQFKRKVKRWKVGEKTTTDELMKDDWTATEYIIRTGSGYFVEFATWGNLNIWTKVENRRFGIILPNSSVRISSASVLKIDSGAVGWDTDFQAANNLDDYMEYLARKVDYNWVKKMVDPLKNKFANAGSRCPLDVNCLCRGDVNEHIILNATAGAAGWGALWGLAPPWLMPAEFVKVQAQYTAQAYLAASIGYLHGKYTTGGDAFTRQLKIDNYVLFAGMDGGAHNADSAKGMGESAATELIQKATELILKKVAPRGLSAVPIIGTVWGVGKGAWDGAKDAVEMGRRAVKYYSNMSEFRIDPLTGAIENYSGKDRIIKISRVIDGITVKAIGDEAFKNNKVIEIITLESPNTTAIGKGAFMGCTKLSAIYLNAPEMTIGENAFNGCTSLATIGFPQGARKMTIGANAFNGTRINDADKRKIREFGYTGAGVGQAEPSYTVTFMVPNGSPIQRTADRNTTVTLPSNPTKQGFTFEGWNTQSNGSGTAFTASTRVTGNVTLYPKWKENAAQPAKPAQPAQPAQPVQKTYNIGDTGPGGGIVFAPGKECSSADLGQAVWASAEKLAKDYRGGSKSDWRLPSKDELNAMYNNLKKNNKGGFKNESYWGKNGSSAFAQNFGGGNTNDSPNSDKRLVRAVRTF